MFRASPMTKTQAEYLWNKWTYAAINFPWMRWCIKSLRNIQTERSQCLLLLTVFQQPAESLKCYPLGQTPLLSFIFSLVNPSCFRLQLEGTAQHETRPLENLEVCWAVHDRGVLCAQRRLRRALWGLLQHAQSLFSVTGKGFSWDVVMLLEVERADSLLHLIFYYSLPSLLSCLFVVVFFLVLLMKDLLYEENMLRNISKICM